jgi:hypothetical protein
MGGDITHDANGNQIRTQVGAILPTCAQSVPGRAAAVRDGPSSGHHVSGTQRP